MSDRGSGANVALVGLITLATVGTASAGTYVGIGIGTVPAVSEQTDRLEAGGRSVRAVLGSRFSYLSVEGALGGFDMLIADGQGELKPLGDAYQLAAALKLNVPLGSGFEVFGRAGVHHTLIDADQELNSVAGNGALLGAGIEYRLDAVLGKASIFIDYQYSRALLAGDDGDRFTGNKAFDSNLRMWTLGLTIGL
jgi:hypothetical protein